MKAILISIFCLSSLYSVNSRAQIIDDTEDTSNSNPRITIPNNRNGDSRGMANPPPRERTPAPPVFSERYNSTPERATQPEASSIPEPGFPGARLSTIIAPDNSNSLLELFERAFQGKLRGCSIERTRRNRGCEYEVIVERRSYPFHYNGLCSSDRDAAKVGCNYNDQKKNSACILKQAMDIGYCL